MELSSCSASSPLLWSRPLSWRSWIPATVCSWFLWWQLLQPLPILPRKPESIYSSILGPISRRIFPECYSLILYIEQTVSNKTARASALWLHPFFWLFFWLLSNNPVIRSDQTLQRSKDTWSALLSFQDVVPLQNNKQNPPFLLFLSESCSMPTSDSIPLRTPLLSIQAFVDHCLFGFL